MIYLVCSYLLSPFIFFLSFCFRKKNKKNILIIQTAKIGDFVSTTPIIKKLRLHFQNSKISILVHPNCSSIAENISDIDFVHTSPKRGYKGVWSKLKFFLKLFMRFDAVIILSPNLIYFLATFWALIPIRISVLSHKCSRSLKLASSFLTHTEWHIPGVRYQISALKALESLGIIFNEEEKINNYFPLANCDFKLKLPEKNQFLVGIGVSAGSKFKSFSFEQVIVLSSKLIAIKNLTIVLVGTSEDSAIAKKICESLPGDRVFDATGKVLLIELGTFMQNFNCFVGVDSGATYIADAVGVPVIDIMGPASSADQKPIGINAIVINSNEPCAPCSSTFYAPKSCHLNTLACIKKIDFDEIFELIKKIILYKI